MAVANVVHRLVAGAGVALAAWLLAGCSGPSAAPQSANGSPPASAVSAASGGQAPAPTPTRRSLLDAIGRDGSPTALLLEQVPAGTTCTASAQLQDGSPVRVSPTSRTATKDGDTLVFSADAHSDETVRWYARCTLGDEVVTRTMVKPDPTPAPAPTDRPTATPASTPYSTPTAAGHSSSAPPSASAP